MIRCRTLARELKRRGQVVIFICRRQPGDLIALLKHEFQVVELPERKLLSCEGLEGRSLHNAWLGTSQEIDASDCLEALSAAGIQSFSWLVVDHYALDFQWESEFIAGILRASSPPKLLVIDDLADRIHNADMILDQNFIVDTPDLRYEGLIPTNARQFLGPYFALLGPEYAQLHPLLPPRSELRRILVFFGGADPHNLTSRTLEALMEHPLSALSVDVVLGHQSEHWQEVEDLVSQRPLTNLYRPLPSLAGLIARADLAIGAGGTTTWERACLGLPSFVVAVASNQVVISQALDKAGHLRLLSDNPLISSHDIRKPLLSLLTAFKRQDSGRMLTDGWGASRIAMAMLGVQKSISLRLATEFDEAILLHWANDYQVRAESFSTDRISITDHHQWFHTGLVDPNRLMFIAIQEDGCPIGQIRFDLQPLTANNFSRECIISISLDRCARGKGLSVDLVRLGLEKMKHYWGSNVEVVAEVLQSNVASNSCFARVGFSLDEVYKKSVDSVSRSVCRWRWRSMELSQK